MKTDKLKLCKKLAYDNSNVTFNQSIVELFKILAKLSIILIIFYMFVYIMISVAIENLSIES